MAAEPANQGEIQPTKLGRPSDDALLASLRFERTSALGVLYDRHAGVVMALCLRIVRDRALAESIVEEVFQDLYEHPERDGTLPDRLVLHARALAIQRRQQSPTPATDLTAEYAEQWSSLNVPSDDPNLRWQRERAGAALGRLSPESRQIVEMVGLDGRRVDEIASQLNLGAVAVRAMLVAGMRAFQDGLKVATTAANPFNNAHFPLVCLDRVRVLVVDDEPDARRLLTLSLQTVGAWVNTAASVAEAMALLASEKPEILLSDLAMPDEDGFDLIRKVRRAGLHAKQLPAVALTAFATKQVRRDAMLAGFQMHVAKPVDPHELAEVIASLTGRTGTC